MSEPFLAEIRIFGFTFAPIGWAFCDGQIMSISQNTALFSLLGTTYGGNGQNNFALPNLQGNAAVHPGQGPGLSPYNLGQMGGETAVTLTSGQMPSHGHALHADSTAALATGTSPAGAVLAPPHAPAKSQLLYKPSGAAAVMAPGAVGAAGGNQPHNNMQPYLALNFCIALQGIFPARS